MKKYLDYHSSYDKLRTMVKEAGDIIRAEELQALIREMPARCQAVIDAEGSVVGPTSEECLMFS